MSQPSKPQPPPLDTTTASLRTVFEQILDDLLATPPGEIPGGAPTDLGFDLQTVEAIAGLAELQFLGRVTEADIDDVRATFANQLDGTHAREDARRLDELFAQRGR